MPKHTPATPLPWETVEAASTIPIRGANGHTVASVRFDERYDGPDAAYIAHAANAYPRLVTALLAMVKEHGGTDPEISTHVPSIEALALLRELGEL